MFSWFKLLNVVRWKFDHTLILLRLNGGGGIHFKKRFHFENLWLLELELNDVVEFGLSYPNSHNFLSKLSLTSTGMNSWGNRIRRKCCTDNHQIYFKFTHNLRRLSNIFGTINLVLPQNLELTLRIFRSLVFRISWCFCEVLQEIELELQLKLYSYKHDLLCA